MLLHLAPEEFPGFGIVSIVEGADVSPADPVADAVFRGTAVHPPSGVEFLVMVCGIIEFRPYRYHDAGVEAVDAVDHGLGIGKPGGVEFVRAPGLLGPVKPVKDDVVEGDVPLAVLFDHPQQFIAGFVAFAALPVTHGPFGHDLRFPGEDAIATDHLVHAIPPDEVVIDLVAHFRPEGEGFLFLLRAGTQCLQSDVGNPAVGFPLQFNGVALAGFQFTGKLKSVGIPGGPPPLGHHQLPVYPHFRITGIVKLEMEQPALLRFDLPFPDDGGVSEAEPLREVLYRFQVFIVNGCFVPLHEQIAGVGVGIVKG